MHEQPNPFAPPATESTAAPAAIARAQRPPLWRSCLTWTTVCVLSAVPSFYWGFATIASKQAVAMVTGILIFIVTYIAADQSNWAGQLRRVPGAKLAMRITYAIRIAITIIFPASLMLDGLCGMASISIVATLGTAVDIDTGPDSAGFFTCLAITLVQGVVLNLVLGCLALPIFGLIRLIRRPG